MLPPLPPSWHQILESEYIQPYWQDIVSFLESEYSQQVCFPEKKNIFKALELTPVDDVRVVILGQDPYHTTGAAMGMAFAIPDGYKMQPSLRNILRELESDIGVLRQESDLSDWAKQGVLLLNTVLTVRQGEPGSHQDKGWEQFTDVMIQRISDQREGIVFVLWGQAAIAKIPLIDSTRHHIITSPHPSPFSAHRGFLGSRPFSRVNQYLRQYGNPEIRWIRDIDKPHG